MAPACTGYRRLALEVDIDSAAAKGRLVRDLVLSLMKSCAVHQKLVW